MKRAAEFDRRHQLAPCAPPRRISNVFTEDQYTRIVEAIRGLGPIGQINGRRMQAPDDMKIEPVFRGELASESICYTPCIEDVFFNSKLMGLARDYRGARFCVPRQLAFNLTAPSAAHRPAHIDAPAYRGLWHVNTPPWLLFLMGMSGLFTDYAVKMVQITSWFWRGAHGGFTYWPDGPSEAPQRITAPVWNEGLVAENQYMFHRAECSLPLGEDHDIAALAFDSTIEACRASVDGWKVRTAGEIVRKYRTNELRLMVHWSCELFDDMEEVQRHITGTDPLTHDIVVERFMTDLRGHGLTLERPSDPLNDLEFRRLLERRHSRAPASYPAEAPWNAADSALRTV